MPAHTTTIRAFALIALIALAAALAGCSQMLPTVTFTSMTVERLADDGTDYVALYHIDNPNPHPLQIEEVHWTLSVGQAEVVSGLVSKNTELPGSKATPLYIYIHVPSRALERAAPAARGKFTYHLEGHIVFTTPLGPAQVPLEADGQMPIIKPLQVSLVKVDRLGATETRVGLSLALRVTNPNDLALRPSELEGQLLLTDRPLITLNTPLTDVPPIPPHGTSEFRVTHWAGSPEVGTRTLDKLIQAPDTTFRLQGQLLFRLPGTGDVTDMLRQTAPPAVRRTQPTRD